MHRRSRRLLHRRPAPARVWPAPSGGVSRQQLSALLVVLAVLSTPSPAAAQLGGPDASGMVYDATLYEFVDITTTGVAPGVTRIDEQEVALPFPFPFYGADYGFVSIGSFGVLALTDGGGPPNLSSPNLSLPRVASNAPDIAVLWDDLNMTAGGEVWVLDDSAANDRFIVSWVGIPHYFDIDGASVQVHLYADGTIQFHYADVDFGDPLYDFGMSATVGIQDNAGGQAASGAWLQVGHNSAFLADGDAYVFYSADVDGDGFTDALQGGDDCDDGDALIFPGAPEICGDAVDQDCDGADALTDADADTFVSVDCGGDDCDDLDAAVHPGAPEVCGDGADNDCDPATPDLWDADADGVDCDADCDEAAPTVFPGAPEVCGDGVDQDCDGWDLLTDLDLDGDVGLACGGGDCDDLDPTISSLVDEDGDGSDACEDCDDADGGNFPGNVEVCDGFDNDCDGSGDDLDDADGDGVSVCDGDCDDLDPLVLPAATEVCDGQDTDCDGLVDEVDADGDGVSCATDCDDADAAAWPGAPELCDGVDTDCDGLEDSFDLDIGAVAGGALTGTSAPGLAIDSGPHEDSIDITGASAPVEAVVVTVNIDHPWVGDLEIVLVSPSGTEVVLVDNRGGSGDDLLAAVFDDDAAASITAVASADAPFTGDWRPEEPLSAFAGEAAGGPWTLSITDTYPFGDDGVLVTWTLDIDTGTVADADADGAVDSCGDCDPADATVFPGAPEVCGDGIDQDCDLSDLLPDDDGDTYVDVACGGDDCDDEDAATRPDALEFCDGVDRDCDGLEDSFDLDIGAVALTTSTMTTVDGQAFDHATPITSTISFATGLGAPIADVNVTLNIDHPRDDDVEVWLVSPAGTRVELFTDVGGFGDHFVDSVLDDQATRNIGDFHDVSSEAPFTGAYRPEGRLADFVGEALDGSWTLEVGDDAAGNNGVLAQWTLDVVTGYVDDADSDGAVDSCGDCDNNDAAVFPGAPEVCGDGVDQDCDTSDLVVDEDADSYLAQACGGDDCDDADPAVHPAALEVCGDGIDGDCSGRVDDLDADGDGFPSSSCGGPDCDDGDATIHPGAAELCDAVDTDCDGRPDELDLDVQATRTAVLVTPGLFVDDQVDAVSTIELATGLTDPVSDVDVVLNISHTFDADLEVFLTSPAGTEVELFTDVGGGGDDFFWTVLDDEALVAIASLNTSAAPFRGTYQPEGSLSDFDGEAIDGAWTLRVEDDAGLDEGTLLAWQLQVTTGPLDDADADGAVDSCGDCDATDPTIFPYAPEICGDGVDQDCDGSDDSADADADGSLNADCGGDDCDDGDPTVFPGAPELCGDGADNDCDPSTADLHDADFDGSPCDLDCDDSAPLVFPGFFEICDDGADNDCDPSTPDLGDADGDGVSCELDCDDTNPLAWPGATELLCTGVDEDCDPVVAPDIDDGDGDTFTCDLDCDDSNPATNPGALEIPCDGIDNDCDGVVDTDDGLDNDVDDDGATCDLDCDDDDPDRFPGNPELCGDGVDNDCSPLTPDVFDADADGAPCDVDCDDDDPSVLPGRRELCGDGIDQDCDGLVDELIAGAQDLDDDDALQVDLCSFSFPFCGTDWDTLYVQDNGRITFGFDDRTSVGTVGDLLTQTPEIAPLWTDLDPGAGGAVDVTEDDGVSLTVAFTAVSQAGLPATGNHFELILWADGMASVTYGAVDASDSLVGFACDDVDVLDADLSALSTGLVGQGTEDAIYELFDATTSPNDLAGLHLELCLTAGDDLDGDGWTDACGDCDDGEPIAFPGNPELCGDAVDNDCDGATDDIDLDGDGHLDLACSGDDCDDSDAAVHPGAVEACDGLDADCDGSLVDDFDDSDADGEPDCTDADDDGDGDPDATDCAPVDPDIYTGAPESCDGLDADCDGSLVDGFDDTDGDADPDCTDPDDDGDGDPDSTDCAPLDDAVFEGAPEYCDDVDSDCDGSLVDGYVDTDGDGLPDCLDSDADGDGDPDATDCAPLDDTVHSAAVEVPDDGVDQDCSGADAVTCFDDQDEDGFGAGDPLVEVDGDCLEVDLSETDDDCDDHDETRHPGAQEQCDGLDNDCDGVPLPDEADEDEDGWRPCDGDCDDENAAVSPSADELCDGLDNDCDGGSLDDELDRDGDGERPCDGDCDDEDPTAWLGAEELCDDPGDQDCDGLEDTADGDPECWTVPTGCLSSLASAEPVPGALLILLLFGWVGSRLYRAQPARTTGSRSTSRIS